MACVASICEKAQKRDGREIRRIDKLCGYKNMRRKEGYETVHATETKRARSRYRDARVDARQKLRIVRV
jgi:hypothetical protein